MKLYSRNNAAKQWILSEIENLASSGQIRVCDIGCGSGSVWPAFVHDHASLTYVGLDTDASEIEKAKKNFADCTNAKVFVADGQKFREEEGTFDVVTAFSALEHVVDLSAFVKTTLALLKSGGVAYLNYDAGHFRSHDIKERLMVPVSQLLAKFGYEAPYMKEVDDRQLKEIVAVQGGSVVALRKHNLHMMKRVMKDEKDETILSWYAYEDQLNTMIPTEKLDAALWSTTLVLKKA